MFKISLYYIKSVTYRMAGKIGGNYIVGFHQKINGSFVSGIKFDGKKIVRFCPSCKVPN